MIIYMNDKKLILDDDKLLKKYIGTGLESDIYKCDNKIIKIYKEICLKQRLNEDNVKFLLKIKTNRILLPLDIIYDRNHEFYGYTMKYIKPYNKVDIKKLKMKKLLEELKLIKEDLLILKDNNIFIDDLHDNNFIYNKKIYFIDPGSFDINKNRSKTYIELFNRELMHDFLIKYVIFRNESLNKNQKKLINELFPLDAYICDILEENKIKNESVYEYTKRIIKT